MGILNILMQLNLLVTSVKTHSNGIVAHTTCLTKRESIIDPYIVPRCNHSVIDTKFHILLPSSKTSIPWVPFTPAQRQLVILSHDLGSGTSSDKAIVRGWRKSSFASFYEQHLFFLMALADQPMRNRVKIHYSPSTTSCMRAKHCQGHVLHSFSRS